MSASSRGVPTLPVPVLRDAVGREAARLSLRRAATEISISPNGLRNFLNGSVPRSATRVKLERWLAARQRVSRPPNVGQLVRLLNELGAGIAPALPGAPGQSGQRSRVRECRGGLATPVRLRYISL